MTHNMGNKDLLIDTVCTNPHQHISILKKYEVVVTHKPTGLRAACGVHKAQHKNLKVCKDMLEYGLVNNDISDLI